MVKYGSYRQWGINYVENEDEAWELFENMSDTFQHHASTARLERPTASNSKKPSREADSL